MATIQELVDQRRELVAALSEVDAQIRARHGEQAEPAKPVKKSAVKK